MTTSTERRPQDPRAEQYDKQQLWVVYDNPADYPGKIVARRYELSSRPPTHQTEFVATPEKVVAGSIEEARRGIAHANRLGLFQPLLTDPAEIKEIWL